MLAPAIPAFLHSLSLGPARTSGRLTVFPVLGAPAPKPDYLALAEALQGKLAEITEIDQGGSVPDLAVVNHGEKPVLLLDGEELAGAKQNRVLNTTILIAALSKTVIPVSCSEHGRWHYTSASFSSSGNVLASKIRRKKTSSVSDSLHKTGHYHSNQGEVWNEIAELHSKAKTSHLTETGAMSDAFVGRAKELDALAAAFPATEGQVGLVVLQDGRVEGTDVLSRPEVYRQLHERLIRSYAMNALVEEPAMPSDAAAPEATAAAFFKAAEGCSSTTHNSPGLGEDLRLNAPQLVGSALVVDGQVIHLALFADAAPSDATAKGNISSVAQRRRYRGL